MIAFFHRGYAGAHIDDDAGALMAEDRREETFRVGARARELVGVADAGRLDLDQHLARARAFQLHGRHFELFAGGECNGGARVHHCSSLVAMASRWGAKVCTRGAQKQERAGRRLLPV